jgi:hypothetical protein
MYLYNVTVIIESGVQDAVRQRIEAQLFGHSDTGTPVKLLQMLDSPHEGATLCIQLHTETTEGIAAFQQHRLAPIQELTNREYPGKVLFFDSTMKYLND